MCALPRGVQFEAGARMFGFLTLLGKTNDRSTGGCRGGGSLLAHAAAGRPDCGANGPLRRAGGVPWPGALRTWTGCARCWRSTSGHGGSSRRCSAATCPGIRRRRRQVLQSLAGGLRALPRVRPGPWPFPEGLGRQSQAPGLERIRALRGAAFFPASPDRVAAPAVHRREVDPVSVEGAARRLQVRAVARARAPQSPGQPPELGERGRHHARTRVHPRAAAGPHERRSFAAA